MERSFEQMYRETMVKPEPDEVVSLLREIYQLQRQLPERNFAKDHCFEEWADHRRGKIYDDEG